MSPVSESPPGLLLQAFLLALRSQKRQVAPLNSGLATVASDARKGLRAGPESVRARRPEEEDQARPARGHRRAVNWAGKEDEERS